MFKTFRQTQSGEQVDVVKHQTPMLSSWYFRTLHPGNVQVDYASEKELIGPVLLTILDTQAGMVWQSQPVATEQDGLRNSIIQTFQPNVCNPIANRNRGTVLESLMIIQE